MVAPLRYSGATQVRPISRTGPCRASRPERAQDWLGSYREFAVLREVLGGMSRRLSRPHLLDGSWEELAQRYDDLSADFRAFYPQLRAFALSQR